jgi:hypothetical protein
MPSMHNSTETSFFCLRPALRKAAIRWRSYSWWSSPAGRLLGACSAQQPGGCWCSLRRICSPSANVEPRLRICITALFLCELGETEQFGQGADSQVCGGPVPPGWCFSTTAHTRRVTGHQCWLGFRVADESAAGAACMVAGKNAELFAGPRRAEPYARLDWAPDRSDRQRAAVPRGFVRIQKAE